MVAEVLHLNLCGRPKFSFPNEHLCQKSPTSLAENRSMLGESLGASKGPYICSPIVMCICGTAPMGSNKNWLGQNYKGAIPTGWVKRMEPLRLLRKS